MHLIHTHAHTHRHTHTHTHTHREREREREDKFVALAMLHVPMVMFITKILLLIGIVLRPNTLLSRANQRTPVCADSSKKN